MWISVQTPQRLDTNSLIKLDRQLPKGIILLDVLHSTIHKQLQELITLILNIANTDIKLLKNTVLGSLTRVNDIDCIHNVSWKKRQPISNKTHGTTLQELQVQNLLPVFLEQSSFQTYAHDDNKPPIKLQDADILQFIQSKLSEMLNIEFACIISKSSTDFGRTNLVEMDPPTASLPVASKPYTIPLKYKSFVDDEIKLLEDAGCISKSLSNWASPICIVKKKPDPSQPHKPQLQMCIDYRKVNQSLVTAHNNNNGKVVSTFPLPKIQELFSRLNNSKYFSSLDLHSDFYHISLTEEAKKKIAFGTADGKYQWNIVPLGLATAISMFQYLMSKVLTGLNNFAFTYLDNVLIFSKSCEEHLQHLNTVFQKFKEAGLKIRLSKCQFFKTQLHYLGHRISSDGLEALPENLDAIKNLAPAKNVDEACQILGLLGYYRSFIYSYNAYSGVLCQPQTNDKDIRLVAYFSGTFMAQNKSWCAPEKEAYTILKSVQSFDYFLRSAKCTLRCDHK